MQSLKSNYFEQFNLDESSELDLTALNNAYRLQQAQAHPDRFANAEETEKIRAIQLSSYLNEAYETLKSPLRRAAYLLSLREIDVEQVDQSDLSMELLLEQIALREKLDDLPIDESALESIDVLRSEVREKLSAQEKCFTERFESGEYREAKKVYHELQFLNKLAAEIDVAEEKRLDF